MALINEDYYNFAITALITVGYQFFFFCIATTFKFDKVTDLAGGKSSIYFQFI